MAFLSICTLINIVTVGAESGDTAAFAVTPSVVEVGQQATVSWHLSPPDTAFIPGIGEVVGDGEAQLSLLESSLLWMATGDVVIWKSVFVSGSKGSFILTSDLFKNPIRREIRLKNISLALRRIYTVFQDKLKFSIRTLEVSENRITLATSTEDRPGLIHADEHQIGSKRIAYLILLEKNPKEPRLTVTVSASVEYRRRIERTWRRLDIEGDHHGTHRLVVEDAVRLIEEN
jgi:hypothetical protein